MHRGVYKVPQDDLQMYLCKLFEDSLPLVDDQYPEDNSSRRMRGGSQFYRRNSATSSLSESSDDGAVKGFNFFNKNNNSEQSCALREASAEQNSPQEHN